MAETDTNAALWKSDERVKQWVAGVDERERKRAAQWRLMGEILPFSEGDELTILDLGAGTGAAARALLDLYPRASALLADFSPQMMEEGRRILAPYDGRYHYVEFDMSTGDWPESIPTGLDAVVTSQCVHHLPDARKAGLFGEIYAHLRPGGWYVNFDPVSTEDELVEAAWQRANDRQDPAAADKAKHRTPDEQARYENHVRYIVPLERQLDYLRSAGFKAVDVYWKHLDSVVYGGCRPPA